jgi:hypothetical protein
MEFSILIRIRGSSSGIATRGIGVRFSAGTEKFLSFAASTQVLGITQLPFHFIAGDLPSECKVAGTSS